MCSGDGRVRRGGEHSIAELPDSQSRRMIRLLKARSRNEWDRLLKGRDMLVEKRVMDYLSKLVKTYHAIREIWLIGSRANGCARATSDWDLLVFANKEVLKELRGDRCFKEKKIDLLIVYECNSFKEPWGGENAKHGNLREWQWKRVSENEAKYIKWEQQPEEEPNGRCRPTYENVTRGPFTAIEQKAFRVWERSNGFICQQR